jgi:hypothetical protein
MAASLKRLALSILRPWETSTGATMLLAALAESEDKLEYVEEGDIGNRPGTWL